jgi:hypothetical protein
MRLEDVNSLINEVFGCPIKSKDMEDMFITVPNPKVYDAESEGFTLHIKKALVDKSCHDCIKSIVEKRKLKMRESKGYLVIYTLKK